MAHDRALLADALYYPHRPQPPSERHGRASPRAPAAFPERTAVIPPECATVGQILQDAGWSTFWLGKNHNVPEQDVASGATARHGRCRRASTASTASSAARRTSGIPTWSRTTSSSTSPTSPEEGYHLSKDLADQAIQMIRDQKASNPSKPWFMWFCPGANHAPHHAPKEYIDKYKGKFDDGYEAYREWVLPRMIEKGILPEGHRADTDQPDARGRVESRRRRAALGHALRRREETVLRAHGRGLRRILRVHRRPGRPDHRLPRADRPAREHA